MQDLVINDENLVKLIKDFDGQVMVTYDRGSRVDTPPPKDILVVIDLQHDFVPDMH